MEDAEDALDHPDGAAGRQQLAADLGRPGPFAALAQDVDQAGDACRLGARVAVEPAEPERGVERFLGAPVVGRAVEDEREALVELSRDRGQIVRERQREPRADGLQAGLVLAALRARHALEPERPRAQVGALCGLGQLGGADRVLDGVAEARADAPVVGHRQALDGGVGRVAVRDERVGRHPPRGERRLALALELVGRREPALGAGIGEPLAARAAHGGQLPPRLDRLGQLAGALGAARVALQQVDAGLGFLVARPQVERLAPGRGRVAIGVDGLRLGRGADQRRAGPRRVARPEPLRGELHALPAGGLERLGELAVQRAAPQPRDVGVERLPAQRMAERGAPVALVVQQPVALQLGQPVLGDEPGHELEVEGLPRHGRRLGRRARGLRQRDRAHQDRVADGVGQRHVVVAGELEPARARLQPPAHRQRARELLDEERQALGAVVERVHQGGRRPVRQQRREQLRRRRLVERRERQIVEVTAAAQVVAQPAEHVVAREPGGAIGADDQQRQLLQGGREPAQQRERRLVGPLQVVQQHERGADRLERAPDGLEDRRPVAARRRLAELGQQQRQVPAQRPEAVEPVRAGAQESAQDGHQRAVGSDGGAAPRAAQHEHVRPRRELLGEPGLADAGLAAQEQQRAVAVAGPHERVGQQRALGLTTEERAASVHGEEAYAPTGAGSGRTTTVSAIAKISSAGMSERRACSRMASGLSAS